MAGLRERGNSMVFGICDDSAEERKKLEITEEQADKYLSEYYAHLE